ncbi:MAG: hypothetical protein IT424_04365 [Pirellulales bacterium]|nr:hypothetical protein [Pirellulales bacterium]
MARNSADKPSATPAARVKPTADAPSAGRPVAKKLHELARRRARALAILAVVAILALGLRLLWRRVAPLVAGRDRYLVPASAIGISPPPPWLVADVLEQVIHKSSLDRRLSILDPGFVDEIEQAFSLHPWVARVKRIEKKVPPGVFVELEYRRPVAVIDAPRADTRELLPVDVTGVHLPAEDVPLIRRQYLPRIMNIAGRPPVGRRWEDGRVAGGVELAAALGESWESLHLVEIIPSARPEVRGDRQYFVYEIVTRGGTRIIWGAAPRDQAPGEAAFAVKLQRLQKCVRQYGPLDTVKAPQSVNVRGELQVLPRMVKRGAKPGPSSTQVK